MSSSVVGGAVVLWCCVWCHQERVRVLQAGREREQEQLQRQGLEWRARSEHAEVRRGREAGRGWAFCR